MKKITEIKYDKQTKHQTKQNINSIHHAITQRTENKKKQIRASKVKLIT